MKAMNREAKEMVNNFVNKLCTVLILSGKKRIILLQKTPEIIGKTN